MLATIGDIIFQPKDLPLKKITRDSIYEWKRQDLVGFGVVYDFEGIVEEKISINGVIYSQSGGGLAGFFDLFNREPSDAVNRMREMASQGRPQYLSVAANGKAIPFGLWAITRINEKQSLFLKNGTPQKIEFTMSLTKHRAVGT